MTPREFSDAADKTRVRPIGVTAARMVLLEGYGYTEAGRKVSPPLSRQAVFQAVGSITRSYSKMKVLGPGWQSVTVVLPSDKVESVLNMEAEALKQRPCRRTGILSGILSVFRKTKTPG